MRRGLDKVAGGGQSRASPERQTVWAERRKSPEVAVKFRSLGLGGEKAELSMNIQWRRIALSSQRYRIEEQREAFAVMRWRVYRLGPSVSLARWA